MGDVVKRRFATRSKFEVSSLAPLNSALPRVKFALKVTANLRRR
jgi:hypothetical protein